jgi:PST family polysaccharide transporter
MSRQIGRAIAWSALGSWGAQAISTVVFLALSRLLGPGPYGLLALIAIFLTVSQSLLLDGFAQLILRARELTDDLLDLIFWSQMALGVVFALGLLLAAGPLSRHYHAPALAPLTAAAAVIPLLQAVGSVQYELIRRELRFDRIAARSFGGALLGGATGLGLALLGWGPWALLAMQVVQAGAQAAVLWASTPWRPRPRLPLHWAERRESLDFGASALFGCALNLVDTQMPRIALALYFGVMTLAYYNFGFRLSEVILLVCLLPVRQVAAPIFSARAKDPKALASALLFLFRAVLVTTAPALAGLYQVAPEAVPLLFGPRWTAAVPFLRAVLVLFAAVPVNFIVGDLITVTGGLAVRRLVHGLSVASGLVIVLVGMRAGPLGTAWLFSARVLAMAPILLAAAARIAGTPRAAFARIILPVAAACAVMMASAAGVDVLLAGRSTPLRLGGQVAVAAVVYALLVLALFRREIAGTWSLITGRPYAPAALA